MAKKTKVARPAAGAKKKGKDKSKGKKKEEPTKKPKNLPASFEATINLHKIFYGAENKKRARKSIKGIIHFARRMMSTHDVRIDPKLNKYVWSGGIKGVPFRARIRLDRKRREDDDGKKRMYTVISWVPVADFKGLTTKKIEE
jgi:large subunit ribosomal protein L31e|eukprot:TRINITY_DN178_c0_g1_i6.p1 TRINITY_DN178_c0_g1~~TRINITY_DN178_c0_g1_i6.p1  ORF type:complete len:143 (+),score=24.99 TRINITY_DN178_c0_g1_i6:34-462(+)